MPLQYLMDYLFEVGPAAGGGFGPSPISHQELLAWQVNMRRMLQPWEISMLRRLSFEWISAASAAEDEGAPAPWSAEEVTSDERVAVGASLRDSIRAMAKGAK